VNVVAVGASINSAEVFNVGQHGAGRSIFVVPPSTETHPMSQNSH
jgi:hypothetical protein